MKVTDLMVKRAFSAAHHRIANVETMRAAIEAALAHPEHEWGLVGTVASGGGGSSGVVYVSQITQEENYRCFCGAIKTIVVREPRT